MRHTTLYTSSATATSTRTTPTQQAPRFTWQRSGVSLALAPWCVDPRQQTFATVRVSVAEDVVPQYALTFTVAIPSGRDASQHQLVARRVTKQHLASTFERAVSARTPTDKRFAQLTTQSQSCKPLARDVDAAVRQWLLRGSAAPSRDDIVLWLLARMLLVRGDSSSESADDDPPKRKDDVRSSNAWRLLICGETGAELQQARSPLEPAMFANGSACVAKGERQSAWGDSNSVAQHCERRTASDSDKEENDDAPPAYSSPRHLERANSDRMIWSDDGFDDRCSDENDIDAFDAVYGSGDEDAPPFDLLLQQQQQQWEEEDGDSDIDPSAIVRERKHIKQQIIAGAATTASTRSLPTASSLTMTVQPTTTHLPFEPAILRLRRSTSSRSANDASLTNAWTQDRKTFELELQRSRKDIASAQALQRKSDAIAHLRQEQQRAQTARKLRAHDQRVEDAYRVQQSIADTLEFHSIAQTLATQTKRSEIAARRERERLTHTMRTALGRSAKHVNGPVFGTGPLSQRELDAQTRVSHQRNDDDTDGVVYDLHGRRHAAADAGDVAAVEAFDAAMRKIKRALDRPPSRRSRNSRTTSNLVSLFHDADTDRSGTLSHKEFTHVLLTAGAALSPAQTHVLFAHFDANASGAIDYGELLWGLFNRRAFLKRWHERRTALTTRGVKLLFYQYDRTGRGALSPRDFQLALDDAGFHVTADELELLVLRFDANRDGYIDYHEFDAFVSQKEEEKEEEEEEEEKEEEERLRSRTRSNNSSSSRQVSDSGLERIAAELRSLSETQATIRQRIHK